MISLFLCIVSSFAFEMLNFRLFENFDKNNDGIITHSQFIEGLNRAFVAEVSDKQGVEYDKVETNNFGREFLGEKKSDGRVYLTDVKRWISSGELVKAFKEWKIINGEGEEHLDPKHKHEMRDRKYFRKAPMMKRNKKDL